MKKQLFVCIALSVATFFATNSMAQNLSIGGSIKTEQNVLVEQVTVELTNDQGVVLQSVVSNGNYLFSGLAPGNYRVLPAKTVNPLNGVSTFDIVLGSRHLLGLAPIASPYAVLAADINRDGAISVWDFVYARMLVLGIQPDFQDHQSWRFVRSDLSLLASNPFPLAYGASNDITLTNSDVTNFNFIGYKVFDLNNSAAPEN